MSSSLGPAPSPPQSLLPHLDHLLRLLAAPADVAAAAAAPSSEAHHAEIATAAAAMRNQLAESSRWAGTLKGGDVAEDEVDEVIAVLSQRILEQRRVLDKLTGEGQPVVESAAPPPPAAPAAGAEPPDAEMPLADAQ